MSNLLSWNKKHFFLFDVLYSLRYSLGIKTFNENSLETTIQMFKSQSNQDR